jgi:hypothetical protein
MTLEVALVPIFRSRPLAVLGERPQSDSAKLLYFTESITGRSVNRCGDASETLE